MNECRSPVLSATLLSIPADVSRFFDEAEGQLPVFLGVSMDEHEAVWQELTKREKSWQWRRAAVAASLGREYGKRFGETEIRGFCCRQRIGPEYVSRLAACYRIWNDLLTRAPLDPSVKDLLTEPAFTFKHYLVATIGVGSGVSPVTALTEAKLQHWSANALARWLASQKKVRIIDDDGTSITPQDDDDDSDVSWRAAPLDAPPGMHTVKLRLTEQEYQRYAAGLSAGRQVLGTTREPDIVLAALAGC